MLHTVASCYHYNSQQLNSALLISVDSRSLLFICALCCQRQLIVHNRVLLRYVCKNDVNRYLYEWLGRASRIPSHCDNALLPRHHLACKYTICASTRTCFRLPGWQCMYSHDSVAQYHLQKQLICTISWATLDFNPWPPYLEPALGPRIFSGLTLLLSCALRYIVDGQWFVISHDHHNTILDQVWVVSIMESSHPGIISLSSSCSLSIRFTSCHKVFKVCFSHSSSFLLPYTRYGLGFLPHFTGVEVVSPHYRLKKSWMPSSHFSNKLTIFICFRKDWLVCFSVRSGYSLQFPQWPHFRCITWFSACLIIVHYSRLC